MSSNFMHQFLSHNRRKRKRSLLSSDETQRGIESEAIEGVGLVKESISEADSVLDCRKRDSSSREDSSSRIQLSQQRQHPASNNRSSNGSLPKHPQGSQSKQSHPGIHPMQPNQPKTRRRWRRMEYYLRTYQESLLQKDGLGIIQRREEEVTFSQASSSRASKVKKVDQRQKECLVMMDKRSKTPLAHVGKAPTNVRRDLNHRCPPFFASTRWKDPWSAGLPFLLLLIPLHVQWDASSQQWPRYEELLAHAQSATVERDHLSQELAKLQDRFRRFVSHVKEVRREEARQAGVPVTARKATHTAETRNAANSTHSEVGQTNETMPLNQKAQPLHKKMATSMQASSLQKDSWSQPISNFVTSRTRNSPSAFSSPIPVQRPLQNSPLLLAESILGQPEWQQEDSATVLPTSSRRVTVSPARILQSLPVVQRQKCEGSTLKVNSVSSGQVSKSMMIQKPIAIRSPPPTSFHRRQVPNPFHSSSKGKCHSSLPSSSSTEAQHPSKVDNPYTPRTCNERQPLSETDAILESRPSKATEESSSSGAMKSKSRPMSSPGSNLDARTTAGSGWISNGKARKFVAEVSKTIADEQLVKRARAPSNSIVMHPEPTLPPDEVIGRSKQPGLSFETQKRKAQLRPPPSVGPFCEVVRDKTERQTLKAHECKECGKFIDAILEGDEEGVYNRHELMCASRHRHRFTPPSTPEDFWELSFVDERDARLRQKNEQQGDKGIL